MMEKRQETFENQRNERKDSVLAKFGAVLPATISKVFSSQLNESFQKNADIIKQKKEELGIKWQL